MKADFWADVLSRTIAPWETTPEGEVGPLPEGVLALGVSALWRRGYDVWVIQEDRSRLRSMYELVRQWLPPEAVAWYYPSDGEGEPAADPAETPVWLARRLYRDPRPPAVVFSHPVLATFRFPSAEALEEEGITVEKGEALDPDFLADFLADEGYQEVEFADRPGTYAWRGMIFDVFPYHAESPVRIEFDDDRIADLRRYHPESQLSEGRLQRFVIVGQAALRPGTTLPFQHLLRFPHRIFLVEPPYWPTFPPDAPDLPRGLRIGGPTGSSKQGALRYEIIPPFNRNIDRFVDTVRHLHAQGHRVWMASPLQDDYRRLRDILDDRGVDLDFGFFPYAFPEAVVFPDDGAALIPYRHVLPSAERRAARRKADSPILDPQELAPGDYVVHVDYGVGVFEGMGKMQFKGQTKEVLRIRYADGDLLFVGIESMHKLSPYAPSHDGDVKLHKLGSGRWKRLRERAKAKIKELTVDLIKLYSLRKSQKGHAFSPDGQLMMEVEMGFPHVLTPDQAAAWEAIRRDMESERPMDRLVCGDVGFGKTELALRAAAKAAADAKQTAVLVPTTVLALQHYQVFKERLEPLGVTVDYVSRFRTPAENRRILRKTAAGKIDILIGTHRLLSNDVQFLDLGLLIIDEEQKFGVGAKEKLRALKTNVDTLALTATPIPRTLQFSLLGIRDISVLTTPPPGRKPVETVVADFQTDLLAKALRREIDRGGQAFFIHHRIHDLPQFADLIRRLVPGARVAIAHGRMPPERLEEVMYFFVRGRYNVLVTTSLVESGLHIPSVNTIIINQAHYFGLSDLYQLRGRVGRDRRQGYCYVLVPSLRALPANARRRLRSIQLHQELGSGFKIAMHDLAIRGAGNLFGAEQSGFVAEMGYETYEKVLLEALYEMQQEGMLPSHAETTLQLLHRHIRKITIESDVPAFLPDSYVPTAAHRMAFYQRLNEAADSDDVDRWVDALRDQYGPLPPEAQNLVAVVRLRLLLQDLPLEKVTHQQGRVVFYLTGHDKAFYQSERFDALLGLLHRYPDRCRLTQQGDYVRMSFEGFDRLDRFHDWFAAHWRAVGAPASA